MWYNLKKNHAVRNDTRAGWGWEDLLHSPLIKNFTPFFNKFSGGEHGESLGGDDFLIPIHFSFTYFTLDRDT